MILVDTCVIADVLTKDPQWFEWSSTQLDDSGERGPVYYNQIIFAELAPQFETQKELENRLSALTFLDLPLAAAYHAGAAFGKYRRKGGKKLRPLPDSSLARTLTSHTFRCSHAIRGASEPFFLR
jgi:hypothetical protein